MFRSVTAKFNLTVFNIRPRSCNRLFLLFPVTYLCAQRFVEALDLSRVVSNTCNPPRNHSYVAANLFSKHVFIV